MVVLEANHGVAELGEEEEEEVEPLVMVLSITAIWDFEIDLALVLAKCFNFSESIL